MYMYPQSNSARSVRDLSGVWDFRFNANEPWQPIAVPASYNDQSPDPEFRRHYGMAYYRTTFTVPEGARRVLRFDAVTHNAVVRLNGQEIASHRGGFLPFEADITALAQPGEIVTLDVEVDNRIGHSSLPVGNEGGTAFFGSDNAGIPAVEAGKARQQAQGINLPNFDFFNYAGITRPVHLYTTPAAYIRDVTVAADMTGTLRYTVDTVGEGSVKVEILDAEDRIVACADGAASTVQVENARLWQPRPGTPYLYTALVRFGKDEYRQKFGFRSVEVSGHKFLINGAPFYFKGPCKHEDSAFRGRGYDACVTVTDLKLYEWLKAAWVSAVPVMPCGIRPDVISTRPVSVSTTNVSTNTPRIATAPWSCGRSTLASAWAWGVEPRPASLENRPRATPKRMDCCTVTPAMPPAMACGSNASTNTCASAPGSALALMTRMAMQPRM